MPFRGKSIRRKIVALMLVPLVSLIALWACTTLVTGEGVAGLRGVRQVTAGALYPARDAVEALAAERRAALVSLADPGDRKAAADLTTAQRTTDAAMTSLRAHDTDPALRSALDPGSLTRMDGLVRQAGGLTALRTGVREHDTTRAAALNAYDGRIDPYYAFFLGLRPPPDVGLDRQGVALVELLRAREAVSREDAVLSAAQVTGTMTRSEQRDFGVAADRQRSVYDSYASLLPGADGTAYTDFWHSDHDALALRADEERVLDADPGPAARQVPAADWRHTADAVQQRLSTLDRAATAHFIHRVDAFAAQELLRAGLAAGFGLVAVLISVVVSLRIGRGLARDMSLLRAEAQEAAGTRLPALMRRLAAGEVVDPDTEVPRRERREDEIGAVGAALDALGRAAVEAAIRQAALRRGVAEVFVNLARRNQVLLHRQLTLLDSMERRTEDAAELADLFRLDHLTTRMRRHAEGLVILSGAAPSRQWRRPVPLIDVVRAAVAEVENYERVEVRRLPRLALAGSAVADVTHLLAELIENGTVFSPPHTNVQVHGERSGGDFRLEIDDRGLGLPPEPLLAANLKLAETPEFELSDTDRLGLFVVARLGRRTGVRVTLGPSPYGGTTAHVVLPASLLSEREDEDTAGGGGVPLTSPAGRKAAAAVPGPAAAGEAEPEASRERGIPPSAAAGQDLVAGVRRSLRRFDVPDRPDHQQAPDVAQDVRPDAGRTAPGPGTAAAAPTALPEERPAPAPSADRPGLPSAAQPLSPAAPAAGVVSAPLPPALPVPPEGAGGPPAEHAGPAGQADAPASGITGDNAPLPRRRRGAAPAIGTGPGGRDHVPAQRPGGPAEAWSTAPEPAEPWGSPPVERGGPRSRTPLRLPRRVRQASLAPQLRDTHEPGPQEPPQDVPREASGEWDPDEVRARMASFQRGWERGREDADEDTANTADDAGRTIRTRPPHETGERGDRAAGETMEGDGR